MCKEFPLSIDAPMASFSKCASGAPSAPQDDVISALPIEAHGLVDFVCDELESLARDFQEVNDMAVDETEPPILVFDYSYLHAAVKAENFQLVEQLCRMYGDMVNENGFTALHAASAFGHVEVVEKLVLFGYDVNRLTTAGTALHCAVTSGRRAVISTLLFAHADPNARLWNGLTPLHLAAKKGDTWSVQTLLEAGANPSMCDANGMTPLDMATIHHAPQHLCNMLVDREAELKLAHVNFDSFLENLNLDFDMDNDVNPFQQTAVQVPLNVISRPMEVPAFG